MKRLKCPTGCSVFILVWILSSCMAEKKNVTEKDSITIVTPADTTRQLTTYPFVADAKVIAIFGYRNYEEAEQLFGEIYPEATIIQTNDMAGDPDSIDMIITSWEFEEAEIFFSSVNECNPFKILKFVSATDEGEFVEWRVVHTQEDGSREFSSSLSFDITERQSLTTATMLFDYDLAEGCTVVSIEETYDGGDIESTTSNSVTFYEIDNIGFTKIITIDLLNRITGYDGDVITNTIGKYQILAPITNRLHDLEITYDVLDSVDQVVESKIEMCKWSGSQYECAPKQD